jgi:hypothetical protein
MPEGSMFEPKTDEGKRLLAAWNQQREISARFNEFYASIGVAFLNRAKDPETLEYYLRYVFTGSFPGDTALANGVKIHQEHEASMRAARAELWCACGRTNCTSPHP